MDARKPTNMRNKSESCKNTQYNRKFKNPDLGEEGREGSAGVKESEPFLE